MAYSSTVSTPTLICRPLWRSFKQRFLSNAVAHVRAGGHALVWRNGPARPIGWLLLPCGPDGEVTELGYWSILALEKKHYSIVERGVAKGLATMRIPRDVQWAVEDWCERDSKWPGSTREIALDCMTCSACCRDNRVVLDQDDLQRWKDAGRSDLAGKPYVRTDRGEIVLRLQRDTRACVHLRGTLCGIYAYRPDNCSLFPAGSEPCLTSREEEFGIVD
jgi:uncharacterized protein